MRHAVGIVVQVGGQRRLDTRLPPITWRSATCANERDAHSRAVLIQAKSIDGSYSLSISVFPRTTRVA